MGSDTLRQRAAGNPYRGPHEGGHRARPPGTRFVVWLVLLAPYVIFGTVLLAALASYRLGVSDVRETVFEVGAALVAGTVLALLLWPAAYLLEHVLRRFRSNYERFRYLGLWILAFAIYVHGSINVLSVFDVLPREHPVAVAIRGVSSALVFGAVPLFLVWVFLAVFQRRR